MNEPAHVEKTSPLPGRFITLEGGDGVGKSTQAAMLGEWLAGRGYEVVRTREPGGTTLGEGIRAMVLHERGHVSPRAEALLYAADRAQHIESVVIPALARGAIVLQDRYIDSSAAYQGVGRGLGEERIRAVSEWASGGLMPELTVLLDLDAETARARVAAARGDTYDRLESEAIAFHSAVRAAFLRTAAAEPDRVVVIDASAEVAEIQARIRRAVETLLGGMR